IRKWEPVWKHLGEAYASELGEAVAEFGPEIARRGEFTPENVNWLLTLLPEGKRREAHDRILASLIPRIGSVDEYRRLQRPGYFRRSPELRSKIREMKARHPDWFPVQSKVN